jgi:hypothetical protein
MTISGAEAEFYAGLALDSTSPCIAFSDYLPGSPRI